VPKGDNPAVLAAQTAYPACTPFKDRRCIFRENRLPEKKSKMLLLIIFTFLHLVIEKYHPAIFKPKIQLFYFANI